MIDVETFFHIIKSRRSIKKLEPVIISRDTIEELIKVAITAPSAHNAQPWRFLVLTDQKLKSKLIHGMIESWSNDLRRDGFTNSEINRIVKSSSERTLSASVLILVCLTMDDMDKYPDVRTNYEYLLAVQSISAAIQNLLLAIHSKGLAACWRCAPLFCMEKVKEVLKIPEALHPQAIIEIGASFKQPKMPPRKPLKDVLRFNIWD